MPIVEVIETVNKDIASVWTLVCDVESYPNFMTPVLVVDVLKRDGLTNIVRWEVLLKGSILQWTESETRIPERYRVEFIQTDGDLERFTGYWQLEPQGPERTRAALVIDFEIGIPMLRDMLNPVAERAMKENSRIMLRSLEEPVLQS